MRRGQCHVDVEVRCLERPVHSGQKGGPIPDPVQILCRLIAGLGRPDGSPDIPGSLAVVAFESQPVRGAANQIVDSARARFLLQTAAGVSAREAGERLVRRLIRNPPHGARVSALLAGATGTIEEKPIHKKR